MHMLDMSITNVHTDSYQYQIELEQNYMGHF